MEDFKNRVNKTKKKINEAKLSKEFKDNLKIIMDKEYSKTTNENSKVRLVENKNSTFKNTKLKLLYHKKIADTIKIVEIHYLYIFFVVFLHLNIIQIPQNLFIFPIKNVKIYLLKQKFFKRKLLIWKKEIYMMKIET